MCICYILIKINAKELLTAYRKPKYIIYVIYSRLNGVFPPLNAKGIKAFSGIRARIFKVKAHALCQTINIDNYWIISRFHWLKVIKDVRWLVCEWEQNINNSINMHSFVTRWGIRSYYQISFTRRSRRGMRGDCGNIAERLSFPGRVCVSAWKATGLYRVYAIIVSCATRSYQGVRVNAVSSNSAELRGSATAIA